MTISKMIDFDFSDFDGLTLQELIVELQSVVDKNEYVKILIDCDMYDHGTYACPKLIGYREPTQVEIDKQKKTERINKEYEINRLKTRLKELENNSENL